MSQASQQSAQQSAAAQEALRMQEAVIRSQAEAALRLAMTQGLSQLNQHQQDNSHSPLRHNGDYIIYYFYLIIVFVFFIYFLILCFF